MTSFIDFNLKTTYYIMSIFRQDYFYKIALVGDSSVGKSSLLKRYCDDHFEETYHATIGVDFKFK